ncbi:MAG: glycosyltransferase family 2 protein [Synechococcales cyanobacterium RM1_1_8]|nr:glycosyltransferase family 2 protein [Synechococcales cyanobacterium RM1_1_8]
MRVAIVLPVHNEEENLERLVANIDTAFGAASETGSSPPLLLFIDDGSQDRSKLIITRIIELRGHARCISFSRNFGHQPAVMAGFTHAPEDCVVLVMDSDGQDPPEVGCELVNRIYRGLDIAYGVRRKRKGHPLKRLAYWGFYRILSQLSMVDIPLDAGDFCAYSPRAVKLMLQFGENQPYVRGLRAWIGLNQVGVPYDRPARYAGKASYDLRLLLNLAFDGIVSFSVKPLRLALILGLLTFFLCVILCALYLGFYIFDIQVAGVHARSVPGFTTITLLILAFSGFQMMLLGIIGEYLGRLFEESKRRPRFIVAETIDSVASPHVLPLK